MVKSVFVLLFSGICFFSHFAFSCSLPKTTVAEAVNKKIDNVNWFMHASMVSYFSRKIQENSFLYRAERKTRGKVEYHLLSDGCTLEEIELRRGCIALRALDSDFSNLLEIMNVSNNFIEESKFAIVLKATASLIKSYLEKSFLQEYVDKNIPFKMAMIASVSLSWENGIDLFKSLFADSKGELDKSLFMFENSVFAMFLRVDSPFIIRYLFSKNKIEAERKFYMNCILQAMKCYIERLTGEKIPSDKPSIIFEKCDSLCEIRRFLM
jgi:hypothetical protein